MSCEAVNSFLFNTERLTNIVIRHEEFFVLKLAQIQQNCIWHHSLKYFISVNPYGMT